MLPASTQNRGVGLAALFASLAILLFPTMLAGAALGGSFEDALAAHERGDYSTALRLYLPLANGGDSEAQHNLGVGYREGQGVPQDYAEAVKWTRKAADQGIAVAQTDLGRMYHEGHGVPQDFGEAAIWFRIAAERGFADSQSNLGIMYYQGRGVTRDYAKAVKWYRKAADQGNAVAQFNLGFMYAKGQGVPRDFVEAYKWFDLAAPRFGEAAANMRDMAVKNRDIAAAKMTRAQIAEAQRLARARKPK